MSNEPATLSQHPVLSLSNKTIFARLNQRLLRLSENEMNAAPYISLNKQKTIWQF